MGLKESRKGCIDIKETEKSIKLNMEESRQNMEMCRLRFLTFWTEKEHI